MTATSPCTRWWSAAQEFHLPFWDVESGHIRIFDMLRGRVRGPSRPRTTCPPSDPNYVFMTGTDIEWISDGSCPTGNPAAATRRYNNRIMDVRFFGTPSVCGVYRIELLGWGGFNWDLFANCTGRDAPGFMIYSNVCEALAAWNALAPAPDRRRRGDQLGDCPSPPASSHARQHGLPRRRGCAGAGRELHGRSPERLRHPERPGGGHGCPGFDLGPFSSTPVTVLLDPGSPGAIFECSEAGSNPVTCSPPASVSHERTFQPCPEGCHTSADAGEPSVTICEGESLTLDGSGSAIIGCTGRSSTTGRCWAIRASSGTGRPTPRGASRHLTARSTSSGRAVRPRRPARPRTSRMSFSPRT